MDIKPYFRFESNCDTNLTYRFQRSLHCTAKDLIKGSFIFFKLSLGQMKAFLKKLCQISAL